MNYKIILKHTLFRIRMSFLFFIKNGNDGRIINCSLSGKATWIAWKSLSYLHFFFIVLFNFVISNEFVCITIIETNLYNKFDIFYVFWK